MESLVLRRFYFIVFYFPWGFYYLPKEQKDESLQRGLMTATSRIIKKNTRITGTDRIKPSNAHDVFFLSLRESNPNTANYAGHLAI